MKEIVLTGGVRTAIGDFGGTLKDVPPMELAEHVIGEVMRRSNVQPEWIDKVIFGCCFAPMEQNIAIRDTGVLGVFYFKRYWQKRLSRL